MLKKLSFLVSIIVLTTVTGCSNVQKSNTLRAVPLTPKAQAAPMIAELEVDNIKTLGQAKGKTKAKDILQGDRELEQEAIAAALKQSNADVLVGANFFQEKVNDSLTVTVVGYPAKYKNFRPKEILKPQTDIQAVVVGGTVSVQITKPENTQEPVAEKTLTPPAPVPVSPEGNIQ